MRIRIKLLSDLCTHSGETYNSIIDTDVVYDEYGLPYIPAKRIKGCIREAALEMRDFGMMSDSEYTSIFGMGGKAENRSAFTISNAYLKGYDEQVRVLSSLRAIRNSSDGVDGKAKNISELTTAQNILAQYTCIRTQTAVDLDTGVAEENSLRTMRVVRKGLEFEADIAVDEIDDDKLALLEQAISLVKHMGMARSRGLGLVCMTLDKATSASGKDEKGIDKSQLGDRNKLTYSIYLKSPVIFKSPQGDQTVTEDYISGGRVLGLIAEAMGDEEYRKISRAGLIVSNAYISDGVHRSLPARASLQKEKDQKKDTKGEHAGSLRVVDMLADVDTKNKQMTSAGIKYVYGTGDEYTQHTVDTQVSYHHKRPDDKSIGRAIDGDDSSFYQLASIKAGQTFMGYVLTDRDATEAIHDTYGDMRNVHMGYGRNAEFGDVEFSICKAENVSGASSETKVEEAVITLASDLIVYNENGAVSTNLDDVKAYISAQLGVDNLVIEKPFLNTVQIGGYNVTWGARKPICKALGKGSTFILKSPTGFDINKINGAFIGERCAEGYGEIVADTIKDTIYVNNAKEKPTLTKDFDTYEAVKLAIDAEFKRLVQQRVQSAVSDNSKKLADDKLKLNAALSKLRLIYRDADSCETMKREVEGIEKEEKNKLCSQIIGWVVPEKIKSSIDDELVERYGIASGERWRDDKIVFKHIYGAYLTELKHYVKRHTNQTPKKGNE